MIDLFTIKPKIANLLIVVVFVLNGCQNNTQESLSTLELVSETFLLDVADGLMAAPISVASLANGSYVVLTESRQILLFDEKGKLVKNVEAIGQGGLEVESPTIVRSSPEGFAIWCSALLKMVVFDAEGNPLKAHFGFNRAIRKFEINQDHIIATIQNLADNPYIQVYDRNQEKVIDELGTTDPMQVVNNFNGCSGGLASIKNKIVWMPSHDLTLFTLENIPNQQAKEKSFITDFFKQPKMPDNLTELVNTDIMKALELGLKMSVVTGIYPIGDELVITGDFGEGVFDAGQLDLKNRKSFILLLSKDMNPKGWVNSEYSITEPCALYFSGQDYLGRITLKEGEDDYQYWIEKLYLK